jgi:hypothetical protein
MSPLGDTARSLAETHDSSGRSDLWLEGGVSARPGTAGKNLG